MRLFDFGTRLCETPFFQGFSDTHCHILPGVDDGFQSLKNSLEALRRYEALGVREVWLTPHIMEDMPKRTEDLQRRFEDFKAEYGGPLVLHLAAENMMDAIFDERLSGGDILPALDRSYLVETSCVNAPNMLESILDDIRALSHFPLLAHPERYFYMSESTYRRLYAEGVRFQLNLGSLVGLYGAAVKKKAEMLLENGYYFCVGTDLHSLGQLDAILEGKMKSRHLERLLELRNR